MRTDTIAAIATGMSSAGIGIVRISGSQAFEVADRIFRDKRERPRRLSQEKDRRVYYGYIFDGDEKIDEVLVLTMRGPHSYTAEDTVEINCHGGILVVRKILETVIRNGARTAEPGAAAQARSTQAVRPMRESGQQVAWRLWLGAGRPPPEQKRHRGHPPPKTGRGRRKRNDFKSSVRLCAQG